MRPEDVNRIRHMIEAAETAMSFTMGRQREDLDHDTMLRFALMRAGEIIGEAASKISSETRDTLPQVPWFAIVSMRNRLIHAYFDIDHDVLWKTVIEEIPELSAVLRPHLPAAR